MARPRKFKTEAALKRAWEKYKDYCDNRTVPTVQYNKASGQYEKIDVPKRITYTINGFCTKSGISRQAFYDTYAADPAFADTVTRMREECETDAREKFEMAEIPSQLAGLWMSNYGYTTKTAASVAGSVPVIIDDLSGDS